MRRMWALALCGAAVCTALGSAPVQARSQEQSPAHVSEQPSGQVAARTQEAVQAPAAPRTGVATGARAAARERENATAVQRAPGWSLKESGSTSRFRGLSAVSRSTAWVAGSAGTVLRTGDGGATWRNVSPPGASELEFRDIETFGPRGAVVLAIGEGDASRVFRTEDGGAHWTETFRNDDPAAFYNCVTFFDRRNGIVVGDPVDGRFRVLSTRDGGRNWRVLPGDGMPAARQGEANFAASGQCLTSSGARDAWFATGGADASRVFHTSDRGHHWTAAETPLPAADPARGVFGLAFRDARHGLAVGGHYEPGQPSLRASAVTGDGGAAWKPSSRPVPEYRSGVSWLPHTRTAALAVGPTGSDLTLDGGRNWRTFDRGSYDTVDCARGLGCWASGEKGRIARLEPTRD